MLLASLRLSKLLKDVSPVGVTLNFQICQIRVRIDDMKRDLGIALFETVDEPILVKSVQRKQIAVGDMSFFVSSSLLNSFIGNVRGRPQIDDGVDLLVVCLNLGLIIESLVENGSLGTSQTAVLVQVGDEAETRTVE